MKVADIVSEFSESYASTPQRLKIIDAFLVTTILTVSLRGDEGVLGVCGEDSV